MSAGTRQPKGIPVGGQFAATTHADPEVRLDKLREYAKPLPYPIGSRAMSGNQFGTVTTEPDRLGNIRLRLDDGWSLITKSTNVVPWDAHLDSVMPVPNRMSVPGLDTIPQEHADRMLRRSLVKMRNALESTANTGQTYYQGIAWGEAEVVAALMDADSDPEAIRLGAGAQLLLGLPLGSAAEELRPEEIKRRSSAPLSGVRALRLAGYFTSQAVQMQTVLGAKSQNEWGNTEWTKQGAMYAYAQAAVRFADGAAPGDNRHHEDRFTRLLMEGETNTDTIIGETFDEGSC
ncbi:hypothetical protein ACQCSX_22160 (plasmid) [Pseudarthrobacter sp. P1]|uniref:hypothetical protein n=1 Tax=Pseudarthrobacter sp. P1 TaxID=3418418 RepID=UPI003CEDE774